MKRLSVIAIVVTLLLQLSGGSVHAIAALTPTFCPKRYSFALTASGTRPLVGTATDGHPSSIIGTISFDEHSDISGVLAINSNGAVSELNVTGATCVSGTDGALGTIDFTTSTGHPLVFDFVSYVSPGGLSLLFADATPSATNSTTVLIGTCSPVPVLLGAVRG